MNKNTNKIIHKCEWCGEALSQSHKGPCPKCGKEGEAKRYVSLSGQIHGKSTIRGSLTKETRREFFEGNPKIKWLIIAIDFGSPFLGLIIYGWVGFIVGFVFASISHLLAPYAVIKVREITHNSS